MGERHVRDGLGLADKCLRSAANDAVVIDDPEGIEPDRNVFHGLIVQATPGEIIAGHADANDKIVAAPPAHRFEHFEPESQTVGQFTAIVICSAIRIESPELIDEMAMAGHDFTAIEISFLQPPSRIGEPQDKFVHGLLVDFVRRLPVVGLTNRRGAVHAVKPVHAPTAAAAMGDLRDDRNVVLMDGIGKLLQVRNDLVIEQLDAVPIPGGR